MNTRVLLFATACFVSLSSIATAGEVRTWTDKTGQYTIDASLIAFDDDQVIIERASDKQLGAVAIDQLSKADQEYLQSKEAIDAADEVTDALQKWTLRNGLQVNGRLVNYGRRQVVVRRARGKVYVNDRAFENLPAIYQRIVPLIVAEAGNKVEDAASLEKWLASRGGAPQTFVVDGVVLELENGDEYGIPFFMFSDADLAVLKPGWDAWLAANTEQDYDAQQQESTRLQVEAALYRQEQQQLQEQVERRRIAQMQLGLQAVDAGITDVWEVTLYPGRGTPGPPLWVTGFARDSRSATQQALANNPGYVAGPVRKVSGY
jgi:hypothetical protein